MELQGTLLGTEADYATGQKHGEIPVEEGEESLFSPDFRAALDYNRGFIYIIEPDTHQILYCNHAFRDLIHKSPEGRFCYEEFFKSNEPCGNCPASIIHDVSQQCAVEVHRRDGRWLLAQASPLPWNGKNLALITCTDITAQKKAEEALRIRNEEYRILVSQSGKQLLRYDIKTGSVESCFDSDRHFAHFEEAVLKSGTIADESREEYRAFFRQINDGVSTGSADLRMVSTDGHFRWHHADYSLIYTEDGVPSHAIISFFDNTEQYEKELAYRQWQLTLDSMQAGKTVFREINLSQGIIEKAENLRRPDMGNPGDSFSEFVRSGQKHLVLPEDAEVFGGFFDRERLLRLYCAGVSEDTAEYRILINGKPCWYRAELQMVKYPFSDEIKAFIVYTNINKQKREMERLAKAASVDSLTGLLNKGTTEEKIKAALMKRKAGEDCALFMIDIDNFKQVNDCLGHIEGDATLRHAAGVLAQVFRKTDIVGRVGGDEFMAFMPDGASVTAVHNKAAALVDRIRIVGESTAVTVSVGAVLILAEEEVEDFETLYHLADRALYVNKNFGKDRYYIVGTSGQALSE